MHHNAQEVVRLMEVCMQPGNGSGQGGLCPSYQHRCLQETPQNHIKIS